MWTKDQILEHLNYDAETGKFTFKDGVQAGANIKGYVYLHLGKLIPAHRVVWFLETGVWPEKHLDHKDRIRHHNWFDNLRETTQAQNNSNQGIHLNNTSGFKGVNKHHYPNKYPSSHKVRWMAQIRHEGKRYNLGYFDTPEEAAEAYDNASIRLHGEFGVTNRALGLLPKV